MRDEKEERKKQARSHVHGKLNSTQHTSRVYTRRHCGLDDLVTPTLHNAHVYIYMYVVAFKKIHVDI